MKILLVHIRPDLVTRNHELDCFIEKSGLCPDDFVCVDILNEVPKDDVLVGTDALIIGGSGDYLISKNDIPDQIEMMKKLILEAREKKIPILGVC